MHVDSMLFIHYAACIVVDAGLIVDISEPRVGRRLKS